MGRFGQELTVLGLVLCGKGLKLVRLYRVFAGLVLDLAEVVVCNLAWTFNCMTVVGEGLMRSLTLKIGGGELGCMYLVEYNVVTRLLFFLFLLFFLHVCFDSLWVYCRVGWPG